MVWVKFSGLRKLSDCLTRFGRDRSGALMVTYALILPFLLGVIGLGVESGIWYASKRNIQTQADAAALSGAYERRRGNPSYSVVSAAALKEAERNGYVNAAPHSIVINNPPTSGPSAGNQASVEVIVTEQQQPLFSSLFLNQLSVKSRSVATVETTGTACVLAMDPSASNAIMNQGNPTILMDGCVMAANSTDSSAISISGSAIVDADSLWTAGDISIGGSATVSLDSAPTINAWPLQDPYAGITIPTFGACDHNSKTYANETATIDPGVFCSGLTFGTSAVITLNPGTYYIDEGDLKFNASAYVRCSCPDPEDGVTFVLTSSAGNAGAIGTVTINGGADVILRAPTDPADPFKGILVYQDPLAPAGQSLKFNGGSTMLLTGALYAPSQTIEWSGGNSAAGSTCTQIVGNQVKFVGNTEIVNTGCETAGITPLAIVGVKVTE
ncbi:MAG: pilus assembly protein [Rhodospirillaceae bacterium]|jgi:Flp pilus assembly protein TadG|nr:pilus assembly protein [Rhodospirillaceae bacterium]MBT5456550.1 pilus assembly protein [Rhodospirillaceae bacterium]